jgi:hypothetical protein
VIDYTFLPQYGQLFQSDWMGFPHFLQASITGAGIAAGVVVEAGESTLVGFRVALTNQKIPIPIRARNPRQTNPPMNPPKGIIPPWPIMPGPRICPPNP